jgi:hypothetical protein
MRYATYAATVMLLATAGYSALAQVPNTSPKASNISPADTKSEIAPVLPAAAVAEGASVNDYLNAAKTSLAAGKTGQAQQELEMAETRVLDRSVAAGQAGTPSDSTLVSRIHEARENLGRGDSAGAMQMIDRALAG